MGKSVWHFLKQNGWLLNVFCTLSVLSWRQDSLQSKAPRYFWHCFGLRCLSVKRCFTELLVVWDLIKNQQREPSLGYIPLPSQRFFLLCTSPIAALTGQGSILATACMDQTGRSGAKSMVWFFSTVLLLCWASDNLLLSRRSHTVTFFLGLRKPQKIIRLLLKSSPCYLDFRVSQFCLIYCLAYIVKESIRFWTARF